LLTCHARFGAVRGQQEQIRDDGKTQSGQYLAGLAGL